MLLLLMLTGYAVSWAAVLGLESRANRVMHGVLESGERPLLPGEPASKKESGADSAGVEAALEPPYGPPPRLDGLRLVVLVILTLAGAQGVGMLLMIPFLLMGGPVAGLGELAGALLLTLGLASPGLFLAAGARRALRQDSQRRLLEA